MNTQSAMSVLDIFAWIVLLILVASGIALFFIAGELPGHIAKIRNHPQARLLLWPDGHADLRLGPWMWSDLDRECVLR